MLFCKVKKGYCRYCGETCPKFKLDKKNPKISICKANGKVISETTPSGDAIIKSPGWCPKK